MPVPADYDWGGVPPRLPQVQGVAGVSLREPNRSGPGLRRRACPGVEPWPVPEVDADTVPQAWAVVGVVSSSMAASVGGRPIACQGPGVKAWPRRRQDRYSPSCLPTPRNRPGLGRPAERVHLTVHLSPDASTTMAKPLSLKSKVIRQAARVAPADGERGLGGDAQRRPGPRHVGDYSQGVRCGPAEAIAKGVGLHPRPDRRGRAEEARQEAGKQEQAPGGHTGCRPRDRQAAAATTAVSPVDLIDRVLRWPRRAAGRPCLKKLVDLLART